MLDLFLLVWNWLELHTRWVDELGGDKSDTITIDYTQTPIINEVISTPAMQTNADILVEAAKRALRKNLSAGTGVPYYVACAISVNKVHTNAFSFPIGGGASTADLYEALLVSKYFKLVQTATAGCIVIAPTGMGKNKMYPHGHVGIVGNFGICSNDSSTGLWSENYANIEAWKEQFETTEGYPTYIFERI